MLNNFKYNFQKLNWVRDTHLSIESNQLIVIFAYIKLTDLLNVIVGFEIW